MVQTEFTTSNKIVESFKSHLKSHIVEGTNF